MNTANARRCEWAYRALQAHRRAKGEPPDEPQTDITDLITDLLHLAQEEHGLDPETITRTALGHLEEETA